MLRHRLFVPVGDGVGGECEADVVEGLEQDGADVVRSVLVADDSGDRGLAAVRAAPTSRPQGWPPFVRSGTRKDSLSASPEGFRGDRSFCQ